MLSITSEYYRFLFPYLEYIPEHHLCFYFYQTCKVLSFRELQTDLTKKLYLF